MQQVIRLCVLRKQDRSYGCLQLNNYLQRTALIIQTPFTWHTLFIDKS